MFSNENLCLIICKNTDFLGKINHNLTLKLMHKFLLTLFILSLVLVSCGEPLHTEGHSNTLVKPEYYALPDVGQQDLPFSEAVKVGNILYLSGQLGSTKGKGLVEGGIQAETRQTMDNIKAVLNRHGSSMDQIIKCTCMLADIAEWPAMNEVYVEYFPNHKPARSAFAGTGLALGARVEIECMAWVE